MRAFYHDGKPRPKAAGRDAAFETMMGEFQLRRCFAAALAMLVFVFIPTSAPCEAPRTFRVVNIMPAFWNAWSQGVGKPLDDRVRLFKTLVIDPYRSAYDDPEFRLDKAHIGRYLTAVRAEVPLMHQISSIIASQLAVYQRSFVTAFPDMKPTTIYLMPSMFTFDGQTRNGTLYFGLDGIARFEGAKANPGVLITHELFHAYHFQVNPRTFGKSDSVGVPLYRELWGEGLATYVSYRLNPGATAAQALLSSDLAALSPAKRHKLACLIEPKLSSTNANDATMFFDAGVHPDGLPVRGGYLIGFLVAHKLSIGHELADVTRLLGPELRHNIRLGVQQLCTSRAM